MKIPLPTADPPGDPPDDRLSGETPLRQAQLVMLKLLKAFHGLCEVHGLRYWLDAGTLLGAVRHGGFIPWDDDVDVLMPLDDYRRFCVLAERELPSDMFFQTPKTDPGFDCPWVKIRDRYSHLTESSGPYPYSQAIFIDIFPAVHVTARQSACRLFYVLLPPYGRQIDPPRRGLRLEGNLKRTAIALVQLAFLALMKLPGVARAFRAWAELGETAWEYEPPIRWRNRFPDGQVFPLQKITFEGAEFWGPADPHRYLTDYFGDYMTPPPETERVSEHGVEAIFPIGPNPHWSGLDWNTRRPMTILHLVTNADLGGAPRVVTELANRAIAAGHRVAVGSMTVGPFWDFLAPQVERCPLRYLKRKIDPIADIRCIQEIKVLLRRIKPDIVHLHSSKMGVIGRIAAGKVASGWLAANRPSRRSSPPWRTVYTIHGFDTILKTYRYFLPLEQFLAPWTAAVVAVSRYDYENASRSGINTRLELIPNGASDRAGREPLNQGAANRLRAERAAGRFVVLTIARLAPPKRFDLFLAAARRLSAKPIAFFWIGNVQTMDPSELPPNVVLLGELPEAGDYANLCDLFLLLSDYEGLPMSILEALSCGKPVVASKVGGIGEAVGNDEAGRIIPNDEIAAVQAIEYFSIHPKEHSEAGKVARQRYEQYFSADAMHLAYEALYRSIINQEAYHVAHAG